MKKIKLLLYLFSGLLYTAPVVAQEVNIEKEFKKIHAAFKSNNYLSYDVQYLYAKESAPSKYIDTVNGRYMISGNLFWGQLDNVEYVQTDSMFVSVYHEDKVVLVNSSPPAWLHTNINWDSAMRNTKEKFSMSVAMSDGLSKISIRYLNDSIYKRIEFWYDQQDYTIKKMQYVLRQPQELAVETNDEKEAAASEEFVIIEIRFSNYNRSAFGKEIFETRRYVGKSGKEFKPSKKYTDYTVLVGSPGLLN